MKMVNNNIGTASVLLMASAILCTMLTCTLGFATISVSNRGDFIASSKLSQQVASDDMTRDNVILNQEDQTQLATTDYCTRRSLLIGAVTAFVGLSTNQLPAQSAEESTSTVIWLTGKAPKVPGQKPRDKNDVSGTRKDPNFLRSIADCKSKCESLGKPKDECLSECQDICCTTYEQCTFAIVPRI